MKNYHQKKEKKTEITSIMLRLHYIDVPDLVYSRTPYSHSLLHSFVPFSRVNRRKLKCRILNSFFFAIGDKGKTTIKLLLNGISERIKRTKWAYKVICMIPVKIYSVLLSHQIVTKKRLIWKKILNQHITQEKPFAFQSPGSHHFLSERITRFSYHITQRFS